MGKFSHIMKTTVFALGLTVFGLAPATQALADQKYNKHRSNHGYNNHNKGHKYNRHRDWRNNYRHNHKRYHKRHGYYRSHGYYRNRGRGDEVALGLLAGGLLFYAMTANQRGSNYDRNVYVQQQPVYVQPQQQQWTQKQPVVQPQNIDRSCLQVREYQTTITVGGQSVPAYGQSCLQEDGSWKLGPAIPEPGY